MSFVCQSEFHTGDRLVREPVLEKRIEYRRRADYGRERVVKLYDVCRPCMVRETEQKVESVHVQGRL